MNVVRNARVCVSVKENIWPKKYYLNTLYYLK